MACDDATVLDLAITPLRALHQALYEARPGARFTIVRPDGCHNLAVGLERAIEVVIAGHAGYYAAGMNQHAHVRIAGNAGTGVAENMMSGRVEVTGSASQSAGATGHGGLLVIDGDAGARCGIAMKGIDIVVKGSVGHQSAFMAQSGTLVVLGDADAALGDSLYEARLFVAGRVASLGADCEAKPMGEDARALLLRLLAAARVDDPDPDRFTLYGSARRLYHFRTDHASAY